MAVAQLRLVRLLQPFAYCHTNEIIDIRCAVFLLHPMFGQDPVQVAPENYRVVFENERVRVLAFHAAPGAKWALHAHPDAVVISLNGYEVRNIVPGSKPTVRKPKPGDVAWIPARSHTGANIGGTDMECMLVELKEPKK